jgi:hypothetical protein
VWACAAVWRVAVCEKPGWRRIAWAIAAAVLSVQCLYHDAALLAGVCISGAAVALWQRRPKVACITMLIGLPAAVSLLPYVPIIARVRVWSVLLHCDLTPGFLWGKLCEVTGAPDPLGIWLWSILAIAGVALAGWNLRRRAPAARDSGAALQLCAGAMLILSVLVYGGFLMAVKYPTQPWYYLEFLSVAALCLDTIFGQPSASPGWRLARLLVAVLFAISVFTESAEALRPRNTNVDLIAAQLNVDAAPGDLVLFNQFECAITMNRYYHGKARMITVPPLDDHLVHRYDIIQRDMQTAGIMQPVFKAIADTLRGGGRIWFIGWPALTEPGQLPPRLPPLAKPADGKWPFGDYLFNWMMLADGFLNFHAARCVEVKIPGTQPINPYEDQGVSCYSGWR